MEVQIKWKIGSKIVQNRAKMETCAESIENISPVSPFFQEVYKNRFLFYALFIEDWGKKAAFWGQYRGLCI
jgi:hypothetical protein